MGVQILNVIHKHDCNDSILLCSRREFDSRHLHQKQMASDTVVHIRFLNVGIISSSNLLLMGMSWFRQG